MKSIIALILLVANLSLDDIIMDIYQSAVGLGETDLEQIQTDLHAIHESPIDLNATDEEELSQLYFLTPQQITDILLYAERHPFAAVYELQLIPSLTEWDIRNLVPFVRVSEREPEHKIYAREVFHGATHELVTRVDARNIESYSGSDPMYVQGRYRFDFQRRVTFGAQLRRPAGGQVQDLQYGAYLQLKDIGCLHTFVAGNYQASFGQGLVLASPFHSGKSMYVASVGQTTEGLRYYSSVDGNGLHGAGATLRWEWNKHTRLDVSAIYSLRRANDSTWHHLAGANITFRHKRLQVELTAIENIWSDSIHPYSDAAYNRHYFRGRNQAVIGASARYNHGWFDAFCEVAVTQNEQWGAGVLAGSRFYPSSGIALTALYRYYSPWFDNAVGYAFSETSRIGDENGGYIGWDITRWNKWRLSGYADVFYFTGPKYGIPNAPSIGYDAMVETRYVRSAWQIAWRIRARKKGESDIYSTRLQADVTHNAWTFRTSADANITPLSSNPSQVTYGVSIAQDIAYRFSAVPLTLRGRVQFFDAREWTNRIYQYEYDVLYAYSIPSVYGLGGRAYVCLQWKIIPHLSLYCRVSETVYDRTWATSHKRSITRTDLHFLLRATL